MDNMPEIRDIAPLFEDMTRPIQLLPIVLGAIAIIVIILTAWRYLFSRRSETSPLLPQNRIFLTNEQKALRMLDELLSRNLIASGQIRLFYTQMSFIFRNFLEEEFANKALSSTTSELVIYTLSNPSISTQQSEMIKEFMTSCDISKFANVTCDAKTPLLHIETCRRIIQTLAIKEQ